MTIAVSVLMTRVDHLAKDADKVRWTDAERLLYLNDGQRDIVMHKPEANSTIANITLVAGTKQAIAATGIQFMGLVRNMGTGSTPGRAITMIDRKDMDQNMPDWHADDTNTTVKHWMSDDRSPRSFYCYPPIPASPAVAVEGIWSVAPTDCTSNGNINLPDIYFNALLDYVLFRCFSKDSESAGMAARAVAHYTAFANAIGIKTAGDKKADPRSPH